MARPVTIFTGQCVGDAPDERLDGFAPADCAGNPEKIREWAIQQMKYTAQAAKNMGCYVVTGFMGSPIWKWLYFFPTTTQKQIEDGYNEILTLWTPIFDEFARCGVKFALEVHPSEIAYDYYSAQNYLKYLRIEKRSALTLTQAIFSGKASTPCCFSAILQKKSTMFT